MSAALEKKIGYQFRNSELLTLALTHPSVLGVKSNQRLEFLGDSVLGIVVAHILYELFPYEKEGELARRFAGLVRGETLAQVARDINLGEALHIGTSEKQAQGRENDSNLEDAMEALLGAIYLDGGLPAAEAFIRPRWNTLAQDAQEPPKDGKTALQEWAQARGLPVPAYAMLASSGPSHAPLFTIEARVQGHEPETATASAKRLAEQSAASLLLARLSSGQA